jgi:hypothetical protein
VSDEEVTWLNPEHVTLLKSSTSTSLFTSLSSSPQPPSSSTLSSHSNNNNNISNNNNNNNDCQMKSEVRKETTLSSFATMTSSPLTSDSSNEFKMLIEKAFQTPLPFNQIERILTIFEREPNLVHMSGLTPKRFPQLVENNPPLAVRFLIKLMPSPQITEYV